MDLVETDDHFVLKADLPGLSEEDVHIDVEDDVLTVSGERKAEHEDKREGYVRVERSYGAFRRSLTLPEGVDPEAVSASFDRGVLEIRIPKPEERKPRRVAIQVGSGPPPSRATRPPRPPRRPTAKPAGPRSARARGRSSAPRPPPRPRSGPRSRPRPAPPRACRRARSTNHSATPPSTTSTAPPSPARWMNFSALWPTKYASRPIDVAHAMPPRAFQNRKVGHDMRVAPAIHAAVMRRPVTQRPRKTALGP